MSVGRRDVPSQQSRSVPGFYARSEATGNPETAGKCVCLGLWRLLEAEMKTVLLSVFFMVFIWSPGNENLEKII